MPVTITWTGHATWLINTGSGVLLVDPFFDECPTASMKADGDTLKVKVCPSLCKTLSWSKVAG